MADGQDSGFDPEEQEEIAVCRFRPGELEGRWPGGVIPAGAELRVFGSRLAFIGRTGGRCHVRDRVIELRGRMAPWVAVSPQGWIAAEEIRIRDDYELPRRRETEPTKVIFAEIVLPNGFRRELNAGSSIDINLGGAHGFRGTLRSVNVSYEVGGFQKAEIEAIGNEVPSAGLSDALLASSCQIHDSSYSLQGPTVAWRVADEVDIEAAQASSNASLIERSHQRNIDLLYYAAGVSPNDPPEPPSQPDPPKRPARNFKDGLRKRAITL